MAIYPPQFLIESSICLLVFYGFYALFLQRETFFQLNRWYLLLTPLLSMLLPILHWEVEQQQAVAVINPWALQIVRTAQTLPQNLEQPLTGTLTLGDALWLIYLIGLAFMLFRLVRALYSLRQILQQRSYRLHGPAASFFGHILHHRAAAVQDRKLLDAHEQVHVRQGHSYDVLFLELLIAIYWFHPLIYAFRRQLRLVHEFIADANVVQMTGQRYPYARLLVRHSTVPPDHALLNTFASFTKKRLLMLSQNHSPAYHRLKYLMALPLLTVLAALFSFDMVDELPQPVRQPMATATQILDRMARTPLGHSPGPTKPIPVLVLDEIIITAWRHQQGNEIEKRPTQTPDPSTPQILDEVVIVAAHPLPGKNKIRKTAAVRQTKPIVPFSMTAMELTDTLPQPAHSTVAPSIQLKSAQEKYLLIIDGTPYPKDGTARAKALDPNDIKSINVSKGQFATANFGPAAKDGVVEIITKSGSKKVVTPYQTSTPEQRSMRIGQPGMTVMGTPEQLDTILIIIDGEVFFRKKDARMQNLNPKDIDYVNVYRGDKAVARFGPRAEAGVIEIFTKNYPRQKAKEKGRSRVSVKIPRKVKKNMVQSPDPDETQDGPDYQFRLYPSPAKETIELSFRIQGKEQPVTLAIYDAQGKIMQVIADTSLSGGSHRYQLTKPTNWPNGIYYARLIVGDQLQTQPFVFQ